MLTAILLALLSLELIFFAVGLMTPGETYARQLARVGLTLLFFTLMFNGQNWARIVMMIFAALGALLGLFLALTLLRDSAMAGVMMFALALASAAVVLVLNNQSVKEYIQSRSARPADSGGH